MTEIKVLNNTILDDIPVIDVSMSNAIYRGPKGDKGDKGDDGFIQFEELTPEQKEELRGPQGKQGPAGKDGAQGPAGESGVYIGSEVPTDPSTNVWIDIDGEATGLDNYYTKSEVDAAIEEALEGSGGSDAPVAAKDWHWVETNSNFFDVSNYQHVKVVGYLNSSGMVCTINISTSHNNYFREENGTFYLCMANDYNHVYDATFNNEDGWLRVADSLWDLTGEISCSFTVLGYYYWG
jgi:hypothetical protein